MKMTIELAGLPVALYPENPETAAFFASFALPGGEAVCEARVTESDRARYGPSVADVPEPCAEYGLLAAGVSRCLLQHSRVLCHGVALWIGDKAWLITAPSGTGKTTQYRLLKQLYGEQIRLICGDKPVLEQRGELVFAHPSPWPGKERFPGEGGGALCGVVLLEQAGYNAIRRLDVREAVFPLFREFLYAADTEENARTVGQIAAALLRLPVWKLENRGDEASARLLYETVTKHENL